MGMKLLQNIDTFEVVEWEYFKGNGAKFIPSLMGLINRGKHPFYVTVTDIQVQS